MKLKSRFLVPDPLTVEHLETMAYWIAVYNTEVDRVQRVCQYFSDNKLVEVKHGAA